MINNSARVLASTKDMSRAEWLEHRRRGIGGSDAAALMGASAFATPLTVYADKLGLTEDKETTEAMRQGIDLEEYVARRFTEQTGLRVRKLNKLLQHPEHDFMLANIDREVVAEEAGFEAKTTSVYNKTDFDGGEVSPTYYWQCQHYMAVTGAKHWYLAVLVLSKAFHVFKIERNDAVIKLLIDKERAFWYGNVIAQNPPLPTGNDADDNVIGTIYGCGGAATYSEVITDLNSVNAELEEIEMLERDKKHIETKINAAKQNIKLAMGANENGLSVLWRVSWKPQRRVTVDAKALERDHPALFEKYAKTSTSRVMRISKLKE